MLKDVASLQVGSITLFILIGILAMVFMLAAAVIAILNRRGILPRLAPWHQRLAMVSVILALAHVLLAAALIVGF
jgi:hypothetical protein